MKKSVLIPLVGIFLLLILYMWFNYSPGIKSGEKAPLFEGKNNTGKYISIDQFTGKLLIIDFWASWCGPCKEELPALKQIYSKYKNAVFKDANGLEIVSVSLDRDYTKWINAIEYYNLLWDGHLWDSDGSISARYQVNSIPHVYLVDGNGNVIVNGTDLRGKRLEEEIRNQLK